MLCWMGKFWREASVWTQLALVLLLWGGHGVLTLRLFGPDLARAWTGLTDERPVVAGRHALHYRLGIQGAEQWRARGDVVGYDPTLSGGIPLTPWFDSGARPAEVFAFVGGTSPAAYKLGVAVSWLGFPLLAWFGAACLGWAWSARNAALALMLVLCWSPWGLERFRDGDLALLHSTGCLILAVTLLPRFQEVPSWSNWLGLVLFMSLTLFWLPFMGLCLLPAVFLYYFCAGSHRPWRWHLALGAAVLGALVVIWPWLAAFKEYWWLLTERSTSPVPSFAVTSSPYLAASGTLSLSARLLYLLLLMGGACGVVLVRRGGQGNLFALLAAMSVAWGLNMLGPLWEGCNAVEPERFVFTMLVLAVLPTAQAALAVRTRLLLKLPTRWVWFCISLGLLFLELALGLHRDVRELWRGTWRVSQLPLGLSPEYEACLFQLRELTNTNARIFWEETARTESWSPLLSSLTQRTFIGGLGPGPTEHVQLRWANGAIAGKPLHEWSAKEMTEFCRRYNVGWVVGHSPKGVHFWQQFPGAILVARLPGGGSLFALSSCPTFFLRGQGRVTQCDHQRLTLEDLEPEQGRIVVSFHHHDRMQASDQRVHLERAAWPGGPLPLLQLRLSGPVARVTIQW